jgi:hypothetical protein
MYSMRRLTAFAMVALLALTMAFAVLGCGAKKEEASSTPPASETPPAGGMMSDSTMMSDSSSMGH